MTDIAIGVAITVAALVAIGFVIAVGVVIWVFRAAIQGMK